MNRCVDLKLIYIIIKHTENQKDKCYLEFIQIAPRKYFNRYTKSLSYRQTGYGIFKSES
jgi:hypothetical protein